MEEFQQGIIDIKLFRQSRNFVAYERVKKTFNKHLPNVPFKDSSCGSCVNENINRAERFFKLKLEEYGVQA